MAGTIGMGRRISHLGLGIGLSLFAATAAWAGGAGIYEMGTPDLGTAAAGRAALAQDASTAYGNPAGMTRLSSSQVLLGVMPFWVGLDFDADRPPTDVSGGNGGNAGGFSPLPSWGGWLPGSGIFGVYSLNDDLKFGFSVNSTAGGSVDYNSEWSGRYFVQRSDLLTLNFNPTVAYRISPLVSVGAGFSVQYAKVVQKVAINNILDRGTGDGRLTFKDDTVGFGGNAGVLLEPFKQTRVGLTYRSRVEQCLEDGLDIDNPGPLLSAALDRSGLLGKTVDLSMTIPQEVMLSAVQELTPKLAIMGNFGWQNWNKFGKPQLGVSDTSVTLNQEYDDTFHGAFGIQARIFDPVLLSLGFAYDSSAVSDAHRSPALPMDEQFRYAAGLQYDWSDALTIGTAYEYLDIASAPIDKSSRFGGTLVGDYSTFDVHFLTFNLIWRI